MAAVASRYARAFADAVLDLKLDPTASLEQLKTVASLSRENAELRQVWENPSIPADQKRGVLDAIVARTGAAKQVRNFLAVLIDHQRIVMLDNVVHQVERELHRRLGLTDAEITSARDLNANEKQGLLKQIERITGKRVVPRYAVDAALIGGAVVKLGSTIYDGSVRGQLRKMKEELSAG